MIAGLRARIEPPRVRWTCDGGCPTCLGFVWVDDWTEQTTRLCEHARPWPRWARALHRALNALDDLAWRARNAWTFRPAWLHRWWWTGEMPF